RGRFVPGLMGIAQQTANVGLRARFAESVLGMASGAASMVETVSDKAGHWVAAHADWSRTGGRWHHAASGVHVAVHGVLHGESDAHAHSGSGAADHAEIVGLLYSEAGARVGSLIEGAFCALIVDAPRARLLLINDVTGTFPLYWHVRDRRLVFGP